MERRSQGHTNFGQYVRGYISKRNEAMKKLGGRNLGVRFGNRFKAPSNRTAKIRLIPGEYKVFDGTTQPFYQYVQFYSPRTKRSFVSSKEFKMVDGQLEPIGGKCLGWDLYQQALDEGVERDKRPVGMRVLHAFTGIHLAYFHLVTVTDDNGKPMRYKRGERKGEVIKEKVECEGRRCPMCRDKIDKVFGKKVHWSLGSGHLELLAGYIADIAQDCKGCGTGRLETVGWECPECGDFVVDEGNTNLSDEEINEITCNPYKCKAEDQHTGKPCTFHGFLQKVTECDNPDCQDPIPTSIWDVDLEVKSVGDPPKVTLQIPRWTLTELDDEHLLKMAEPYKFDRIFGPDPLDKQAELLKMRNPHKGDAAKQFTRDYDDENEAEDPDYAE